MQLGIWGFADFLVDWIANWDLIRAKFYSLEDYCLLAWALSLVQPLWRSEDLQVGFLGQFFLLGVAVAVGILDFDFLVFRGQGLGFFVFGDYFWKFSKYPSTWSIFVLVILVQRAFNQLFVIASLVSCFYLASFC